MIKTNYEREPDVEVLFEFNGTRRNPASEGYRPHHLVRDGYLTTGSHHYYDAQTVPSDGRAKGTITFITPEAYPHSLWVGKRISIQEGERIVGYATVLKVFNPLLLKEAITDKMKFYKNNAYPEVFLHDCQFKAAYENQSLMLMFDNGFCIQKDNRTELIKGCIRISDIPLDEVSIRAYKGKTRFGKYTQTVTDIEFSDLADLLQDYSLEVIDEYYCMEQVLYQCCLYPYREKSPFDRIDITVCHEGRALEYYIDE